MAVAVPQKNAGPYAVNSDETNLDTVTPNDGQVTVAVTFTLTGSVAQVQADYATLAAVSTLTSPSATLTWDDAG